MKKTISAVGVIFLLSFFYTFTSYSYNDTEIKYFNRQGKIDQSGIIKVYSGAVSLSYPFDEKGIKPILIKNQKQYENFIKQIPEYWFTGKTREPVKPRKNGDPLLKKPKINFNKQMVIVLYNDSLMGDLYLTIREKEKLIVGYRWESVIVQQPGGWFRYVAVVVKKKKQVKFQREVVHKQHKQMRKSPFDN